FSEDLSSPIPVPACFLFLFWRGECLWLWLWASCFAADSFPVWFCRVCMDVWMYGCMGVVGSTCSTLSPQSHH
ncbi:hypothetical protein COCMIDRAFT_94186, partial [Bipolaris oryzae ATCC 44560]